MMITDTRLTITQSAMFSFSTVLIHLKLWLLLLSMNEKPLTDTGRQLLGPRSEAATGQFVVSGLALCPWQGV